MGERPWHRASWWAVAGGYLIDVQVLRLGWAGRRWTEEID
jgi:hypothetical protein